VRRSANAAAPPKASAKPAASPWGAIGQGVINAGTQLYKNLSAPQPATTPAGGVAAPQTSATPAAAPDWLSGVKQPEQLGALLGNPLLQPLTKPLLSVGGAPALFGITDLVRHGAHNFKTLTQGPIQ
jgi:hypothetical protein